MPVRHITLGSWPSRHCTTDLDCKSASALAMVTAPKECKQTPGGQIDRVGIESGVALRGGKTQDERGKQNSKAQHVDLIALFHRVDHKF